MSILTVYRRLTPSPRGTYFPHQMPWREDHPCNTTTVLHANTSALLHLLFCHVPQINSVQLVVPLCFLSNIYTVIVVECMIPVRAIPLNEANFLMLSSKEEVHLLIFPTLKSEIIFVSYCRLQYLSLISCLRVQNFLLDQFISFLLPIIPSLLHRVIQSISSTEPRCQRVRQSRPFTQFSTAKHTLFRKGYMINGQL